MSANTLKKTIKPILFNAEMVRAILFGEKTQTRRPVINQQRGSDDSCPLDADYLYVLETFFDMDPFHDFPAFREMPGRYAYKADLVFIGDHNWRPSIHMPRAASRLTLKVGVVRCQRLHEMTRMDAKAEGFAPGLNGLEKSRGRSFGNAELAFRDTWDSIYGESFSWASNPWVYVCDFELIKKNIDDVLAEEEGW